ncbi:MAG TPA: hypothetical protein PL096_06915 [Micropepsaceae bacterium]|nr:hypothetical protein [Micropepsaceae bacterium]
MKLARWIFLVAGVYGLAVLTPAMFAGPTVPDGDPLAPYAAYFYGFVGIALVFQLVFLLIASDPARYRPLMALSVLEKASFFVPGLLLYSTGRLAEGPLFYGSMIDGVLLVLFVIAFVATRQEPAK